MDRWLFVFVVSWWTRTCQGFTPSLPVKMDKWQHSTLLFGFALQTSRVRENLFYSVSWFQKLTLGYLFIYLLGHMHLNIAFPTTFKELNCLIKKINHLTIRDLYWFYQITCVISVLKHFISQFTILYLLSKSAEHIKGVFLVACCWAQTLKWEFTCCGVVVKDGPFFFLPTFLFEVKAVPFFSRVTHWLQMFVLCITWISPVSQACPSLSTLFTP